MASLRFLLIAGTYRSHACCMSAYLSKQIIITRLIENNHSVWSSNSEAPSLLSGTTIRKPFCCASHGCSVSWGRRVYLAKRVPARSLHRMGPAAREDSRAGERAAVASASDATAPRCRPAVARRLLRPTLPLKGLDIFIRAARKIRAASTQSPTACRRASRNRRTGRSSFGRPRRTCRKRAG